MLSKEHRIVPWCIDTENRISVIPIKVTPSQIKLPLGLPEKTIIRGVSIFSKCRTKKISRSVLHCIQPGAVGFGPVELPSERAMQHVFHDFLVERLVALKKGPGDTIIRPKTHVGSLISCVCLSDRLGNITIIFRIIRVPKVDRLVRDISFEHSMVSICCPRLCRNVN